MTYNIVRVLDDLRASGSSWHEIATMPGEQLIAALQHVGYETDDDLVEYVEMVACDRAADYER